MQKTCSELNLSIYGRAGKPVSSMRRNKATPSAYLILRRGAEILLGLRRNTGYFDGYWGLPADHIEAGEMPTEALVREVAEEIGLTVDPARLGFVHAMYTRTTDNTGERCDYFFELTVWPGEPYNAEPDKCTELRWFALSELPGNFVQKHHLGVTYSLAGIRYSEVLLADLLPNPSAMNG